MRLLPALLLCSFLFGSAAHADAVDDYIEQRLKTDHIPGVSLAVLRNGQIVKTRGYGLANVETGTPATPDTVYPIASVTKQFVAAGILLLQQDGKLTLDDRVCDDLPGLPAAWRDITIRELLNHTSGLPDIWNDLHGDLTRPTTTAQIIQTVGAAPLAFVPGEKWDYSNTDYIVLAAVITKVSGEPFDVFLDRRIFQPLGMSHTRLFDADAIVPQRAGLYRRDHGQLLNGAYMEPSVARGGDGGLVSTAADLAKWDLALDGHALLSDESRRAMWEKATLKDGSRVPYGLGWEIQDAGGHPWIVHSGSRPGAEAVVSRFPDDGLAVVLLTNLDHANVIAMARGVAGLYVPALAPPSYPPIPDTEPQIKALVSAMMADATADHPDDKIYTPRLLPMVKADWDPSNNAPARLGPMHAITLVERTDDAKSGRVLYRYRVVCEEATVLLLVAVRDGRIDDFGFQKE